MIPNAPTVLIMLVKVLSQMSKQGSQLGHSGTPGVCTAQQCCVCVHARTCVRVCVCVCVCNSVSERLRHPEGTHPAPYIREQCSSNCAFITYSCYSVSSVPPHNPSPLHTHSPLTPTPTPHPWTGQYLRLSAGRVPEGAGHIGVIPVV